MSVAVVFSISHYCIIIGDYGPSNCNEAGSLNCFVINFCGLLTAYLASGGAACRWGGLIVSIESNRVAQNDETAFWSSASLNGLNQSGATWRKTIIRFPLSNDRLVYYFSLSCVLLRRNELNVTRVACFWNTIHRRRSTAARILRSPCHDVGLYNVYVCVWVCMLAR